VKAALEDHHSAPLRPQAKAALDLIAKLCAAPESIQPDDIQTVRDAGASDDAIRDALYVCSVFSVLTRLADSLAWRIPDRSVFVHTAKFLLANGYALPRPLRWFAHAASLRS
jgi:hypothetical protein